VLPNSLSCSFANSISILRSSTRPGPATEITRLEQLAGETAQQQIQIQELQDKLQKARTVRKYKTGKTRPTRAQFIKEQDRLFKEQHASVAQV
jgi:hypothetical protein